MVNWADKENQDRLLAAIIGSFSGPINYHEVARLFGDSATYSTIENRLRKPKKFALQLKEEAQNEGRKAPAPSPARPRSAPPSTKKAKTTPAKDGVATGRVTKKKAGSSKPSTPVKKEREPASCMSMFDGDTECDTDIEPEGGISGEDPSFSEDSGYA